MMTSQVIRTLESKGLLQRTPNPGDSRAMLVDVTAAGADLAVQAVKVVEEADEAFFAAVADRATLVNVLDALS
jgi:DNA-binding MarR family transcriptional regulator